MELTDIEKEKLALLAEDVVCLGALRKIFNENINIALFLENEAQKIPDNEHLGASMRAMNNALNVIRLGFKRIERMKKVQSSEKESVNMSR